MLAVVCACKSKRLSPCLLTIRQGYDVGAFAGLFTAFCPFHDRNTCAVVTREKRLHVQKFEGSNKSLELQKEIPKYRISQLLSSGPRPQGKLLAIGHPRPSTKWFFWRYTSILPSSTSSSSPASLVCYMEMTLQRFYPTTSLIHASLLPL